MGNWKLLFHNVIVHPICGILLFCGCYRACEAVHEWGAPDHA